MRRPSALAALASSLLSTAALSTGVACADEPRWQTNAVQASLFDAQALGRGDLRFALAAGFPFLQGAVGVGVGGGVDLDLRIDTFYGVANQFGVGPKVRVFGDDGFALALGLQLQGTVFRNPAIVDGLDADSARHLTGLRNWGVEPEVVVSTRGAAGSLFGGIAYQATYATEPDAQAPLSGPSPKWGSNLGLRVGGELGFGRNRWRLFAVVGLDLHLRTGDAPALPRAEVGFTFPG